MAKLWKVQPILPIPERKTQYRVASDNLRFQASVLSASLYSGFAHRSSLTSSAVLAGSLLSSPLARTPLLSYLDHCPSIVVDVDLVEKKSPELHRRTTAATVSHQILATVTGAVVVHRRGS
ncbi:hypothetical protein AtEden1_Chr3g0190581 [Arabidopsis thaliana]